MKQIITRIPKWLRIVLGTGFIICVSVALLAVLINFWVIGSADSWILDAKEAAQIGDADCIIVLGCQVKSDGSPSHMLEDRLKRGVALYELDAAPKLLMSGDHGTVTYDEVDAMKRYAVEQGVPTEDVFMDHAGFSTYETVSRAKLIFEAKKVIIVTQQYHLYRAIYTARALGLDAYGVAADYRQYSGQAARDIREVLARVKDFGMAIFQPDPTYLGQTIPISGSGVLTHDKNSDFS